jgi:hypothetical protein
MSGCGTEILKALMPDNVTDDHLLDTPEQQAANKVTHMILERKRPLIGEIEITLFENCPIVCDFCFHDKDSTVGMTYPEMLAKLPLVEAHCKKMQGKVHAMQFNMVGGELFQDRAREKLYPMYYDLMLEIKKICDKYGHVIQVVWVSNFLFKYHEDVRKLLDDLNAVDIPSKLIASYDLSGRPTGGQYTKNIERFKDYVSTINLVATTDSINALFAGDEYFDYLYKNFDLFFDDFIPDPGYDHLVPSDSLYLKFMKYIADNYPMVFPYRELLTQDKNQMHCMSLNKLTIFPDNTTANCRWHRYTRKDFNHAYIRKDNTNLMQAYMDEVGCLSCPYFDRCGFRCYTQWDWKNRARDLPPGVCPIREFFNYVGDTRETSSLPHNKIERRAPFPSELKDQEIQPVQG